MTTTPVLPLVSVVLAVRNEAPHLPRCLAALARQTYPHDRLEVIVVDGRSADGSAEIARAFVGGTLAITVLDNPRRLTPAAFNIGIQAARGDVIVILGARAEVAPDFVAESVAALNRTGADAVGGVVESRPAPGSRPATGRAIALALRSPFGVGDARYRYTGREGEADTVNYGAYRRSVFARVGLFDESLQWVEDDEFNYRLRAAGGRLVVSPRIRVAYAARPTLRALWRQQFRWGLNKPRVARRHPAQMRPRHAVPALFVTSLALSALTAPFVRPARLLLAAILISYGLASATATVLALRRARGRSVPDGGGWSSPSNIPSRASGPSKRSMADDGGEQPSSSTWSLLVHLPLAFATMHVAYGAGMILGVPREVWRQARGRVPAIRTETLDGERAEP